MPIGDQTDSIMDLYILRHAIAVERGTAGYEKDFDRPLTPDGEEKLRRVCKAMRNLDLSFDLILSSPYVRARETAEQVSNSLGLQKKLQICESLGAEEDPRELIVALTQLAPAPGSLLLVGHEPGLSTTVSLLISGTAKSCLTLKKAGLCKLTTEAIKPGRCATLEWLLTPRQMLLMG
jgi:phosphohistidine phosphatase